jgi:hypothetical protein
VSATRYAFRTPDGRNFVGPVQGNGGVLTGADGLRRLKIARDRAKEGRELPIYEPQPKHVRVYPGYSAAGAGEPHDVPLVDADGNETWIGMVGATTNVGIPEWQVVAALKECPTLREVCERLQCHRSTVDRWVRKLKANGKLPACFELRSAPRPLCGIKDCAKPEHQS